MKLITLLIILKPIISHAQVKGIIESGKIEFERSENMYYYLDKYYDTTEGTMKKTVDDYKNSFPKFKSTIFVLNFDANQSHYQVKKGADIKIDFLSRFASENEVDFNFQLGKCTSRKHVLDVNYLVSCPSKNIRWKMTGETREIAGFLCRRANGVIADSIYIVAFYTDQISVKGGPESFSGLPGMILGVAVPSDHVTWFAKSYLQGSKDDFLNAPKLKGKLVDAKDLDELIKIDVGLKSLNLNNFVRRRAMF